MIISRPESVATMIKGRFTFERTEQGQREQMALIRQLAPLLEPYGKVKVQDDNSKPYVYLYVGLHAPEATTEKYL